MPPFYHVEDFAPGIETSQSFRFGLPSFSTSIAGWTQHKGYQNSNHVTASLSDEVSNSTVDGPSHSSYRAIHLCTDRFETRTSSPGNSPGISTFHLVAVKFPTTGPKNSFKCPTSRLDSVVKCPTKCPIHSSSESRTILFGLKYPVSSVFPKCHKQERDIATLNIGPPMITERSGSCFSIWRQTRAAFVRQRDET